jgi:penicillin-binding protein 1A
LEVLETIGFDAAIERSVALLGIPRDELPGRAFDRVYPFGLGVCSVRPVEMARAFAIFVNGGREINPYGIRTIEDRNGRLVLNVERDIRAAIQAKGDAAQVISPQNAFIMTNLLQTGARMGTLSSSAQQGRIFTYKTPRGSTYTLPVAGKTGTTQNWEDAWVIGSSSHLTTAVWFGFDRKGRSLGRDQAGAVLAGRAWARFMYPANEDYPSKDFPRAPSGLVFAQVCSVSGQLLTPECGNYRTSQWFLAGTQPREECTLHRNLINSRTLLTDRLEREYLSTGMGLGQSSTGSLTLDLDFLNLSSEESEPFVDATEQEVYIPQLNERALPVESLAVESNEEEQEEEE